MSSSNFIETYEKLRLVIARETVHDEAEILLEAHIENDLDINLVDGFSSLLEKINTEFELSLQASEVLDELEEMGETIGNLVKIIDEELELG